jgi:RNA polymerase sigma-70 factor (ECF subfamily)
VQRLSADHRAVVALIDIDGLSYLEAAEVLDIPIGIVRSRLHRARNKLRTRLERAGYLETGTR